MKELKKITDAYSCDRKDRIFILDKKNLNVIEVKNEDEDEYKIEIANKVRKSPERFVPIPRREAHKSYEDMVRFISKHIKNKGLQDRLMKAIDVQKGSFSRFKDILSVEDPETLKEWYVFLDKRITEDIITWLRENGIIIKLEEE